MRLDYRAHQKESKAYQERIFAEGQFVVYVDEKNLTATGYIKKQTKPFFNFRFATIDKLNNYVEEKARTITENIRACEAHAENAKIERKKRTEAFKAALKPGVLLYDTWGYEQTNVEFYEVIAVSGSKVTVRELGHKEIRATGWASNVVVPAEGEHRFCGQPTTINIRSERVKINESVSLGLYTGGEIHKSWYA